MCRASVIAAYQIAGYRCASADDGDRDRDHAVDFDANQYCNRLVMRGRAHRYAELGAMDDQQQPLHHHR